MHQTRQSSGARQSSPRKLGTIWTGPKRDVFLVAGNVINLQGAPGMRPTDGHREVEATNGQAGVIAAGTRRFDLIPMDISTPGMDGRCATCAACSRSGKYRQVLIVALTANVLPRECARLKDNGMNDVLNKPLSRENQCAIIVQMSNQTPEERQPHGSPPPDQRPMVHTHLGASFEAMGDAAAPRLVDRFLTNAEGLLDWLETLTIEAKAFRKIVLQGHKTTDSAPRSALAAYVNPWCGSNGKPVQVTWMRSRPSWPGFRQNGRPRTRCCGLS